MSITISRVGDDGETLAKRFTTYLATSNSPSDIGALVRSFELSLRAAIKSPKTIRSYTDTVKGLCLFLVDNGMPTDVWCLMREHIETYVADQVERYDQWGTYLQ